MPYYKAPENLNEEQLQRLYLLDELEKMFSNFIELGNIKANETFKVWTFDDWYSSVDIPVLRQAGLIYRDEIKEYMRRSESKGLAKDTPKFVFVITELGFKALEYKNSWVLFGHFDPIIKIPDYKKKKGKKFEGKFTTEWDWGTSGAYNFTYHFYAHDPGIDHNPGVNYTPEVENVKYATEKFEYLYKQWKARLLTLNEFMNLNPRGDLFDGSEISFTNMSEDQIKTFLRGWFIYG